MEQVANVSETEARKQVMSPIVDHFVALQADFQKQLAALRELTDNWRHEKDPPNKLGNNKSDNLYERADDGNSTVLIDANLVPRAVQQAPDVAMPGDLVTRQRQATVDSKRSKSNATKPSDEGLDRVEAASPIEIPATTTMIDDLARESATDSTLAPESSSRNDRPIGETSSNDGTVIRTAESADRPPRLDSEEGDVNATTSIDETIEAAKQVPPEEEVEQRGLSSTNVEVEVSSSSPAISAPDTTDTEPGQSSSPQTWSAKLLDTEGPANNGSLVQVGKSELDEALGVSFRDSSASRQTDMLQQSENDVSIATSVPGKDFSESETLDQKDESHILAMEALMSAVKSLPEQFLTPFITAMQVLSSKKGDADVTTADVEFMNRLNTLRSTKAEETAEVARNDDEKKSVQDETDGSLLREKNNNNQAKDPLTKSSSSKIVRPCEVPDSRLAKSRSSVPDIKQQQQDVRSVRNAEMDEANLSQTNIATDLTPETFSDAVNLELTDVPEAEPTTGTSQVDIAEAAHSRKNSLKTDTSAENDGRGRSADGETLSMEASVEEATSGESSKFHARSLIPSTTHDREAHELASDDTLIGASSSSSSSSPKEASDSSIASSDKLSADNNLATIDPLLKTDLSRSRISSAFTSDSNAEGSVLTRSEMDISDQKNVVARDSHATNTEPISKQEINTELKRHSSDSCHVATSRNSSPIAKSPSIVEIFDNLEATSRHDKSDTKPSAVKDATHVAEEVEQTISVTYHTPASDAEDETTLKGADVPVEQSTSDLSITQLRDHESVSLSLMDSAANFNNPEKENPADDPPRDKPPSPTNNRASPSIDTHFEDTLLSETSSTLGGSGTLTDVQISEQNEIESKDSITNKISDKNMDDRSTNIVNSSSNDIPIRRSAVEDAKPSDEVSRSDRKQDVQKNSSSFATRSILDALKNLNIFFASRSEEKIISPINEDSPSDPITANIGDATPGVSDTFEIKISESPVITVNDCAPIKDTATNTVESGRAGDVDTTNGGKAGDGNDVSIVARNEPVGSKLPNNESDEDPGQPRKSVIARPVVKDRSPLKKIVRRKSPVKVVRKTGVASRRGSPRKSSSPNSTTVTKARATASEITRTSRNPATRIKESSRSTCIARDKMADGGNKAVAKLSDKPVKQSLINTDLQKGGNKMNKKAAEKTLAIDNFEARIKKRDEKKSENTENSKHSEDKNIEVDRNKNAEMSKNIKINVSICENRELKEMNHETDISKHNKMSIKTLSTEKGNDNSKPKIPSPSKIPVLMHRKIARSTNITPSSPKISLNDTLLLKNIPTKLPVASQAISKLSLKIQEKVKPSPIVRKVDSKDNSKTDRIESNNGKLNPGGAIEITENAKDERILGENRAKDSTEELPKVESIQLESTLDENSRVSSKKDLSANFNERLEIVNAIEEGSSDVCSSDSEYSESSEDTETAKYISDHNSECNSEEFTDAELLLEKTLNEIRSEISESEEERTSGSEGSDGDITCSYETESHDRDSVLSEGSVDEREIKSSELEGSTEEDVYEELSSEGEETNIHREASDQQLEMTVKEADDTRHEEVDISNKEENNSEIAREAEENNLAPLIEAIAELIQPEIIAIDQELSQNLEISDSNTVVAAKLEEGTESREDIESKASDSKASEPRLEEANKMEEKTQSISVENDKTKKATSPKRAKIGRRASTGCKEVKIGRDDDDDALKGVDRPRKRFSLVASCIRRFEGEEKTERTRLESFRRKRQGSPRTEREVSR